MHVAGLEYSAAPSPCQGNSPTAQPGSWLRAGQELCETILRSQGAETEAQSDHVALLVIVRVAGLAQQGDPGQVLALHRVQLSVQLVEVGGLVERVERPAIDDIQKYCITERSAFKGLGEVEQL